ncbi:MAG: dihydropteroate synthase [Thermoplasmata archaeon]
MHDGDFLLFPARRMIGVEGNGLFEVYGNHPSMANIQKALRPGLIQASEKDVEDILRASGKFPGAEAELAKSMFGKIARNPSVPKIMGILNATPDSFYAGSRFNLEDIRSIDGFLDQKPDIIDIGGESTRPGSKRISASTEISRIIPFIKYIRECSTIPISVDTRNPETLEAAIDFDISFVNDISGFSDQRMVDIAQREQLKCIVMHMQGEPSTMQNHPDYSDVVREVNHFLFRQASHLVKSGIKPGNIILDPGIGFGKNFEQNLALIRDIDSLNMGFETLVGVSRKSFIGDITGSSVDRRLAGTLASSIYLMEKKVDYLRVHDIKDNLDALSVYHKLTA